MPLPAILCLALHLGVRSGPPPAYPPCALRTTCLPLHRVTVTELPHCLPARYRTPSLLPHSPAACLLPLPPRTATCYRLRSTCTFCHLRFRRTYLPYLPCQHTTTPAVGFWRTTAAATGRSHHLHTPHHCCTLTFTLPCHHCTIVTALTALHYGCIHHLPHTTAPTHTPPALLHPAAAPFCHHGTAPAALRFWLNSPAACHWIPAAVHHCRAPAPAACLPLFYPTTTAAHCCLRMHCHRCCAPAAHCQPAAVDACTAAPFPACAGLEYRLDAHGLVSCACLPAAVTAMPRARCTLQFCAPAIVGSY